MGTTTLSAEPASGRFINADERLDRYRQQHADGFENEPPWPSGPREETVGQQH